MSSTYAACAEHVQHLHAAVRQLEAQSRLLQLAPLAGREWFELLERKLLPQLTVPPQPSEMTPHCAPIEAQSLCLSGTHAPPSGDASQ